MKEHVRNIPLSDDLWCENVSGWFLAFWSLCLQSKSDQTKRRVLASVSKSPRPQQNASCWPTLNSAKPFRLLRQPHQWLIIRRKHENMPPEKSWSQDLELRLIWRSILHPCQKARFVRMVFLLPTHLTMQTPSHSRTSCWNLKKIRWELESKSNCCRRLFTFVDPRESETRIAV